MGYINAISFIRERASPRLSNAFVVVNGKYMSFHAGLAFWGLRVAAATQPRYCCALLLYAISPELLDAPGPRHTAADAGVNGLPGVGEDR